MNPTRRRVVVTGCGAVSAAGTGVEAFWRAAVSGRAQLRAARRFDTSDYGSPLVGEIESHGDESEEPAAALALAAAREAIGSARLADPVLPPGSGIALGTCLGGALAAFSWMSSGHGRVSPGTLAAPTVRLAVALGARGPVVTISTACASGTGAVAAAADCIRRGEADAMLAGGVDVLSRFVVSGFWLLRALAPAEVRPFDRRRDGLALGEGAGIVVLEERERALERDAPILAEVLGSATSGDANHMTGPSPEGDGLVRAVRAALKDAARSPDTVDFISAHGTGTRFNDRMETIAYKRVFGARARSIPIDSVKPVVGHTLGAAGALETILCVRVLREGLVPPTANLEEPDPECDLDYVPGTARQHRVRCALSCSSAFAGNNAAILLGAP